MDIHNTTRVIVQEREVSPFFIFNVPPRLYTVLLLKIKKFTIDVTKCFVHNIWWYYRDLLIFAEGTNGSDPYLGGKNCRMVGSRAWANKRKTDTGRSYLLHPNSKDDVGVG